jgi:hypothetical protein
MEEVAPLTTLTEIVENQSQLGPRRLIFIDLDLISQAFSNAFESLTLRI